MNNTPIVVLLLPILVNVALRTGRSPSVHCCRWGWQHCPVEWRQQLELQTNLLVVKVAEDLGVPEFGMFDFIMPVTITSVVAILHLWLLVPRMVPDRSPPLQDTSPRVLLLK